ncbi:MAG TPA: ATP-binding protein [Spirochaetales bacterium]|nr:ATP-binding protein [Spirochaetales bacterium]HRY53393.1 ATP-binding protein [Spirochaetia bacterium]HRZ63976.1 ATP-binding protein [Spirochaetia bacterium]
MGASPLFWVKKMNRQSQLWNARSGGYNRPQAIILAERLRRERQCLQVLSGPRQVGKTTLAKQVGEKLGMPFRYASADESALRGAEWIVNQWREARAAAASSDIGGLLALDEIQKIPLWAETVQRLWDEDSASGSRLRILLLGSAPSTIIEGLEEHLAGRYDVLNLRHWSFAEMQDAFGWNVEQYIFYGGYPGAAIFVSDPERWFHYLRDSLIDTTIARDILLLFRVYKPTLLRRQFELACRYSGQVLSYTKMLGQLREAGNTTTLTHYLELLSDAGIVAVIPKYAGDAERKRGSSPKLQVMNNALMVAQLGRPFEESRRDEEYWGRLVESAVGAHLVNEAAIGNCNLYYWRDGNYDVDFVVEIGGSLLPIEVRSGRAPCTRSGTEAFKATFGAERSLVVGEGGVPVEEFLSKSVVSWAAV